MQIKKKIEYAVRSELAKDKDLSRSEVEILDLISDLFKKYINHEYDFSKFTKIKINSNSSKRLVARYVDPLSIEHILSVVIKKILNNRFRLSTTNRNISVHNLFSILDAVKEMSDFTIIKFDFADYFNSISALYAFKKFIEPNIKERWQLDLVNDYLTSTKRTYAGLCTSNLIAEILAQEFDKLVKETFVARGLIFYTRYVDDSILIFNEHLDKDKVEEELEKVLQKIFHDKTILAPVCTTKSNKNKFNYISKRTSFASNQNQIKIFAYLGYEFHLSRLSHSKKNHIEIKYGITKEKRNKYKDRVDSLVLYFSKSQKTPQDLELLRHRILAFSSRTVYDGKKFNSRIWKVKGFVSNYGELRQIFENNMLEADTKHFLENVIADSIKAHVLPHFLKYAPKKYSLYHGIEKNKTLLLVEGIGYDYNSLVRLCNKIGIKETFKGQQKSYRQLVREYLIKTKIGF